MSFSRNVDGYDSLFAKEQILDEHGRPVSPKQQLPQKPEALVRRQHSLNPEEGRSLAQGDGLKSIVST
jgi:hypothetical protein